MDLLQPENVGWFISQRTNNLPALCSAGNGKYGFLTKSFNNLAKTMPEPQNWLASINKLLFMTF